MKRLLERTIMRPVTDELLQAMTQAIVDEVQPERVILFGSRATGRALPDSDVDIIVIEREPFDQQRSRWAETTRVRQAILCFRVPTDVLVYSAEEMAKWRHSVNHVLGRGLREGRLLYERT